MRGFRFGQESCDAIPALSGEAKGPLPLRLDAVVGAEVVETPAKDEKQ